MFFTSGSFEKYSILGTFENQVRFCESRLNEQPVDVFNVINNSEEEKKWYTSVVDHLIDKEHKLKDPSRTKPRPKFEPRPSENKEEPVKIQRKEMPTTSGMVSARETPLIERVYEPKSPEIEPPPVETPTPAAAPIVKIETQVKVAEKKVEEERAPPVMAEPAPTVEQHTLQEKQPPAAQNKGYFDKRVLNLMKNWYPFRFKLNYPRKSRLNSDEQREFIEFHAKFRHRTKLTPAEVKFYKKYIHYKTQIDKERPEFMSYLREYFKNAAEDYQFINPATVRYINEMISYLESNANMYEKYWTNMIEINPNQLDAQMKSALTLEKQLLQLGNPSKIILPAITVDLQPNLKIDYGTLSKRVPVAKFAKKLSKIRLFDDQNVEKLAAKYNCQVAITNSAFVHLIYHLSVTNSDDLKLPFEVKYVKLENGQTQKLILMEKPLVEKPMSKRQQNEKFFKRALMVSIVRSTTTDRNTRNAAKGADERRETTQTATDLSSSSQLVDVFKPEERKLEKLNLDYNTVDDLDLFGFLDKEKERPCEKNDSAPKSPTTKGAAAAAAGSKRVESRSSGEFEDEHCSKKAKLEKSSDDYDDYDDDDAEKGLMIVDTKASLSDTSGPESKDEGPQSPTESIQPTIESAKIPLEKSNTQEESASLKSPLLKKHDSVETAEKLSLFELMNKMQEKLMSNAQTMISANQPNVQTGGQKSTTPHQTLAENPKDYTYIENVHDNVNYTLWTLNNSKNSINVLVRFSIDGFINTETSALNKIVLYPKLEYQPQFGCEKLTPSDYCKMWAKSYIRNSCDLFLCRINVFNSKLISVSHLKHEDIIPKDIEFNPNQSLNHFKNFLEIITNFEEGNYLISKEPESAKLKIMKSAHNKPGAFDLHFYYTGFEVVEKSKVAAWIPIDPELYLPYHYKLQRVPCLFEPIVLMDKKRPPPRQQSKSQSPKATPKKKKRPRRKPKKN